jgi:hypothetical protein
MDWLKQHAYLATWLSPLIAVTGMVLSSRRAANRGKPVNWTRLLLMVLCLTSFPVVVTPTFDATAPRIRTVRIFFHVGRFDYHAE